VRTILSRDATSVAEILGRVSEWMARDVLPLPVSANTTVAEAIRLLELAGARHAWVVEHGEVVGAVTLPGLRARSDGAVAGCMLTVTLSVRANWPLTRAATVLRLAGTDGVVVTDRARRPVGLLRREDVVRAVAERGLVRVRREVWSPTTW
jgi:CBS domain-containing protein